MRAPWLADVLRGAGLTVIETPDWRGRGKELDAIEGLVMHHTASPVSHTLATNLSVVTNGNAVAPGPIAQALFWRTGTVYLIADGRANHAGVGGPWGWLPASPKGTPSAANLRTLGFECVNNGVGEQWSADLVAAMEIGAAAVMRYLDLPADRTLMHSEWSPGRKIDPAGPNGGRIAYAPGTRTMTWSGDAFRARVRDWLTPPPPPLPPIEVPDPTTPPEEDDDMGIIITNAEQHPVYGAPGTGRFLLLESGKLRHITTLAELNARGRGVIPTSKELLARGEGTAWTNAELAAAGIS